MSRNTPRPRSRPVPACQSLHRHYQTIGVAAVRAALLFQRRTALPRPVPAKAR